MIPLTTNFCRTRSSVGGCGCPDAACLKTSSEKGFMFLNSTRRKRNFIAVALSSHGVRLIWRNLRSRYCGLRDLDRQCWSLRAGSLPPIFPDFVATKASRTIQCIAVLRWLRTSRAGDRNLCNACNEHRGLARASNTGMRYGDRRARAPCGEPTPINRIIVRPVSASLASRKAAPGRVEPVRDLPLPVNNLVAPG
jgi:hypothetical protein